jgi:hypothetical protein
MDAQQLIESYVDDVALRLPRELRNDVGLELRALLGDELKAAAQAVGRPPDREVAIEVLRKFGRPAEVAARYRRPRGFDLIEPEYAPLFVKLATICVAVQWALTLPAVFRSSLGFDEWWVSWGLGALGWPGVLVAYFGAAAWIKRRWPADPQTQQRPWTHWLFWLPMAEDWRPGGTDLVLWASAAFSVPLAVAITLLAIDPAWLLDRVLPTGIDASWASYDDDFRTWLRWPLIALMAARTLLYAVAAFDVRWRAPTETVRGCVWITFVGLLYWSILGWDIFASPLTDLAFKAWLSFFLLINTIQIVIWIRRRLTRVRVPKTLAHRPNERADTR